MHRATLENVRVFIDDARATCNKKIEDVRMGRMVT